jgi:hypothetical protein
MENAERPKIVWKKSDRFERSRIFALEGRPSAVFPLLCPVLEYDWLPGWRCEMVHSASGVAEKDAVFMTREAPGRKAVWTTITYEPDRLVEYLIALGRDGVVRLSIGLKEAAAGKTEVSWTMRFTAISPLGRKLMAKRFGEAAFGKMLDDRERELNHYLKHGAMLRA